MRIVVIILWLLLGLGYWFMSKQCCGSEVVEATKTVAPVVVQKDRPLLFNWSDRDPIYGKGWSAYKDSILGNLKENQMLQITGLYSANEVNNTRFKNLGLARADSVRNYMGLDTSRTILKSRLVSDATLDKTRPFEAMTFRSLVRSKNIKEETVVDENNNIQKRTTIYFPFNSTNKLNDAEVESYLDSVVARLKKSSEKVRLVGHTDNVGDNASNNRLGLARANVIKNYLVRKGLAPKRVLVESRGENKPIATNDTDAGRAKNRRTELTIIK